MTHALSMHPEDIADRELRLECIRLSESGVEGAREIYAFVTGAAADGDPQRKINDFYNALLEVIRLSPSGGR